MGVDDALRPAERDRLERFAEAFEDVDPLDYEIFAGTTAPADEIEVAREEALRAIGSGSRRAAVERAMRSFTAAADRALASRMPMPQVILGSSGVSQRPEDHARLLQGLERAVVALIVWDEIDRVQRDVLLGPWARLADRALGDDSG
jgi:hypothetical protein